jgi:hypothetical protein
VCLKDAVSGLWSKTCIVLLRSSKIQHHVIKSTKQVRHCHALLTFQLSSLAFTKTNYSITAYSAVQLLTGSLQYRRRISVDFWSHAWNQSKPTRGCLQNLYLTRGVMNCLSGSHWAVWFFRLGYRLLIHTRFLLPNGRPRIWSCGTFSVHWWRLLTFGFPWNPLERRDCNSCWNQGSLQSTAFFDASQIAMFEHQRS